MSSDDPGPDASEAVPPSLTVGIDAYEDVLLAYETARAAEPCGYLFGTSSPSDSQVTVRRVTSGRNVHPSPRHAFLLAPEEQLAARRDARARGEALIGFWHGHLDGPPRPSFADLLGTGPGNPPWMLIVGRGTGWDPEVRAWRIDPSGGRPVPALVLRAAE